MNRRLVVSDLTATDRHQNVTSEISWFRRNIIWQRHSQLIIATVWPTLHLQLIVKHFSVLSRISAAAFGTVLRTSSHSHGNVRSLCPGQVKPPWSIDLKFLTIDCVGKISWCAKSKRNRLAMECFTGIGEIMLVTFPSVYTLPYLVLIFFLAGSHRHQTPDRSICTYDGLRILLRPRKCFWRSYFSKLHIEGFRNPQNSYFCHVYSNCSQNNALKFFFDGLETNKKFQRITVKIKVKELNRDDTFVPSSSQQPILTVRYHVPTENRK